MSELYMRVIAGLVPATPTFPARRCSNLWQGRRSIIEVAGTSPAMTAGEGLAR